MSLSDNHPAVKRRRSQLLNHLLAFFIFAVVIVPVNFITTPDNVWFFYPLVAWMAPLALHTAYAMGMLDRRP
ncbi:2TM domain-containing protein [Niveispirillum sp. KHB5.9]|uniref:2TM domain-containing protein n=1 Tax=Niveispirillum sp. KHB5.9 TaxID=3400269 RepID=UPI003A8ADDF6